MNTTKPKTVTITRSDLSRALAHPWDSRTCLLAQTAKRNGIVEKSSSPYAGQPDPYAIEKCSNRGREAMHLFDDYWSIKRNRRASLLRRLKAMLPIKVRLS